MFESRGKFVENLRNRVRDFWLTACSRPAQVAPTNRRNTRRHTQRATRGIPKNFCRCSRGEKEHSWRRGIVSLLVPCPSFDKYLLCIYINIRCVILSAKVIDHAEFFLSKRNNETNGSTCTAAVPTRTPWETTCGRGGSDATSHGPTT